VGDEWEHYGGRRCEDGLSIPRLSPPRSDLCLGDDLPDDLRPPIPPEEVAAIPAGRRLGAMDINRVRCLMEGPAIPPWGGGGAGAGRSWLPDGRAKRDTPSKFAHIEHQGATCFLHNCWYAASWSEELAQGLL